MKVASVETSSSSPSCVFENSQVPLSQKHAYEYQQMATDPRNDLNYVKSPVVLYTKLDAECDQ